MYTEYDYNNELYHHGIKGMKWGVRRYQNADGSYTNAGRERYGIGDEDSITYKYNKSGESGWKGAARAVRAASTNRKEKQRKINESLKKEGRREDARAYKYNKSDESGWKGAKRAVNAKWNGLSDNQKKAIKVGAVVAGTALAAYATYKIAGPKIAAYRNNKAIQASVSRARVLLQTGNQNSRNMAKKTIFAANSRTRKAAVNRTFKELHTNSNNVYGIPMTKSVNVARPSWGKNSLGSRSSNFRVTGRAAINYGGNRSYTAKVRSDNAKIKKLTSEIMKDHPHMTTKSAEQYAWYQLWSPRASAYRR